MRFMLMLMLALTLPLTLLFLMFTMLLLLIFNVFMSQAMSGYNPSRPAEFENVLARPDPTRPVP